MQDYTGLRMGSAQVVHAVALYSVDFRTDFRWEYRLEELPAVAAAEAAAEVAAEAAKYTYYYTLLQPPWQARQAVHDWMIGRMLMEHP